MNDRNDKKWSETIKGKMRELWDNKDKVRETKWERTATWKEQPV